MMKMIRVFNTETGQVGMIAEHLFKSPVFNKNGLLVPATEDQKPYVPGMYRSRLVEPAIDPAGVVETVDVDDTETEEDQ